MADFQEGTGGDGGSGGGSGLSAEGVRDVVGDYITQGDNITLTKNDAGDALTISAAEASGVSLEQVHDAVADDIVGGTGLTKTKDDDANTVTLDLDAAGTALGGAKTGGDLTFAAGVGTVNAGVVPTKATATDWAQRTDDTKFLTVLGAATMERSADDGTEWTGFTHVESNPTTGQFTRTRTNATGWQFEFATTAANAAEMDRIIGENSNIRIRVNATNEVTGEAAYAWRDGDTFGVRMKPNATTVGDITSGSAALWAQGALYGELKEQGFITSSDLVEGTDIDLTIGSDGRVTIAYSGTGGGVTYASETQAQEQSATDVVMSPQRVKDWWTERNKNRVWESSDGFAQAASGSDLSENHFWFATGVGGSKAGKLRGGSLNDTNGLRIGLGYEAVLWFTNGDEWIWGHISVVATEANGSLGGGGSATNKVFSFTVGEHYASSGAASATGNWKLEIFSEVASSKRGETAPRSFHANSIDPGSASEGQVLGLTGGMVGFMNDKHAVLDYVYKAKTGGTIGMTTSYQTLPRNQTNGADSDSELTVTPQSTADVFLVKFESIAGSLTVGNWSTDIRQYRGDVKVQRKIGTGAWADLANSEKEFAFYATQGQNPPALYSIVDSPNTTDEVKYRFAWKAGESNHTFNIEGGLAYVIRLAGA